MKRVVKTVAGAIAALGATTTAAAAETVCVLGICINLGGGDSGGGGGVPAAPEIDVTQGFAALAIMLAVALFLRERFNRAQR